MTLVDARGEGELSTGPVGSTSVDTPPALSVLVFEHGGAGERSELGNRLRAVLGGVRLKVVHGVESARWLALVSEVDAIVLRSPVADSMAEVIADLRNAGIAAPIIGYGGCPPMLRAVLLREGADAFVAESDGIELLVATILAVVRRRTTAQLRSDYYLTDGLWLSVSDGQCRVGERCIDLSVSETKLLAALMSRSQETLTAEELARQLWRDSVGKNNALRIQVHRLRTKLGDNSLKPQFIRSIHGIGYQFTRHSIYLSGVAGDEELDAESMAVLASGGAMSELCASLFRTVASDAPLEEIAARLFESIAKAGLCDGAAVTLVAGSSGTMRLCACYGMSHEWRIAMEKYLVPDARGLVGVAIVSTGQIKYVKRSQRSKNFSESIRLFSSEGYEALLAIPLRSPNGVWGTIGFVRRHKSFDPIQAIALEMLAEMLSVHVWWRHRDSLAIIPAATGT